MSQAEKQDVLHTQLAQMEDNRARREAERAAEAARARSQADVTRALGEAARAADNFRRAQAQRVAATLASQVRDINIAAVLLWLRQLHTCS
jgi:hypothetical protein